MADLFPTGPRKRKASLGERGPFTTPATPVKRPVQFRALRRRLTAETRRRSQDSLPRATPRKKVPATIHLENRNPCWQIGAGKNNTPRDRASRMIQRINPKQTNQSELNRGAVAENTSPLARPRPSEVDARRPLKFETITPEAKCKQETNVKNNSNKNVDKQPDSIRARTVSGFRSFEAKALPISCDSVFRPVLRCSTVPAKDVDASSMRANDARINLQMRKSLAEEDDSDSDSENSLEDLCTTFKRVQFSRIIPTKRSVKQPLLFLKPKARHLRAVSNIVH